MSQKKNKWLALTLSAILPGLGQIYNGEHRKGIIHIIAAVVASFLSTILVGIPILMAIVAYSMYDAYQVCASHEASQTAQAEPEQSTEQTAE